MSDELQRCTIGKLGVLSMRLRALGLILLVVGSVVLQGCNNGTPPKAGIAIQPGDYTHAPGEGPGANGAASSKGLNPNH